MLRHYRRQSVKWMMHRLQSSQMTFNATVRAADVDVDGLNGASWRAVRTDLAGDVIGELRVGHQTRSTHLRKMESAVILSGGQSGASLVIIDGVAACSNGSGRRRPSSTNWRRHTQLPLSCTQSGQLILTNYAIKAHIDGSTGKLKEHATCHECTYLCCSFFQPAPVPL